MQSQDINALFEEETPFDVGEHAIFACISGSRAYGTNVETSDVDVRGIIVPPTSYYLGLRDIEQIENQSKDICFYTLKKWALLAYANNPHALELLYMPEDCITFTSQSYEFLHRNRSKFLSKKIGLTFGGYAGAQLKILETKKENKTGRVNLIEKFGYDTKFAAHCVRLYRSGAEALRTGILNVRRPDAAELLEIRNGKYSYDEFVEYKFVPMGSSQKRVVSGGFIKAELDDFEKAIKESTLPETPDFDEIDEIVSTIHRGKIERHR